MLQFSHVRKKKNVAWKQPTVTCCSFNGSSAWKSLWLNHLYSRDANFLGSSHWRLHVDNLMMSNSTTPNVTEPTLYVCGCYMEITRHQINRIRCMYLSYVSYYVVCMWPIMLLHMDNFEDNVSGFQCKSINPRCSQNSLHCVLCHFVVCDPSLF